MDTQDKLLVNKKFPVYVDINDTKDEVLFEFNEFENVSIKNNYNNLIFKFESPYLDEMFVLNPNEEIILNDFEYNRQEDENQIFYPEKYIIEIIKDSQVIKTMYFLVKSNVLGSHTDNIRKIVSDFSKGLELDLKSKKRGKFYKDSNKSLYLPLYEKIVNNVRSLKIELDYILNHPISELEKNMIRTHKQLKQSKKKILKDAKKSISNIAIKKQFYERKTITYNNNSNIVLKKSMKKIVHTCDRLENYFTCNLKYIKSNCNRAEEDYCVAKGKYERINESRFDQRYLNNIKSEYYLRKNSFEELSREYRELLQKSLIIKRIRNTFLESMNESWLNEIDESSRIIHSLKASSNIHYRSIIQFANGIDAEFEESNSKKGIYPYKRTSELYEYYVLILLFEILLEASYEMELESDFDFNLIFDNEEFIFKNGNKRIRVLYNRLVKRTDDKPKDEVVNQNSNSNRPDILVMVYDNDKLINCFILEVKCRRKNNIFSQSGDTPVFSQLKDYTNFWYFDDNLKLKRDAIEKVYAIYPDKISRKEFYNADQICLLSLEPVYDYLNSKSYQVFKEEIEYYIK